MTLNQLEYVIKAAEAGSINQAASQLFVSQSVLSTSIKNLEAELGRSLFIRTTKGIKPTAFGKAFISYITPIEHQLSLCWTIFSISAGRALTRFYPSYPTASTFSTGY